MQINVSFGDVFYIPFSLDRKNQIKRNGDTGQYIQNAEDLVSLGQVVYIDNQYVATLAVFEPVFKQSEIDNIDINFLKKSKIIYLQNIIINNLTQGWWPVVGNLPVRDDMPLQAYSFFGTAFDYKGMDSDVSKEIPMDLSDKLHKAGQTSPPPPRIQ